MKQDGFTLIEVILLLFFVGILIIPAFSALSTMMQMRSRAGDLHREVNGISELVEKIYYEEPVTLLEGVTYETERLTLEAVAIESKDIVEERSARERRGENLYEYRRLDIDVRIYEGGELLKEIQLYRFGLETEAEREFYERMRGLYGE